VLGTRDGVELGARDEAEDGLALGTEDGTDDGVRDGAEDAAARVLIAPV
jgi:hypothetical protein